MIIKSSHQFHIVDIRPWPIVAAFSILTITRSIITWCQFKTIIPLTLSTIAAIATSYQWWRDITREATIQGRHPLIVENGLKAGILLFITSEVIFFASFFWSYFHSRIRPNIEIGQNWPPNGITSFNPINVPLLNTIILLRSGVSITWSHHAIISNKFIKSIISLKMTILLGIYFSILQGLEYWQAEFSIRDSSYGSTFFIATGFHGAHVLIGTTFLAITWVRIKKLRITANHLVGFEAAAWYWHFVDIVWLFLYTSIYWWGN